MVGKATARKGKGQARLSDNRYLTADRLDDWICDQRPVRVCWHDAWMCHISVCLCRLFELSEQCSSAALSCSSAALS